MQYISPFHFVELPPTGAIDRKDISLARKKMLAELELNDGKGIEINGKEVSKNDIVLFFDELQQSSQLSWHIAIYRDKVLLGFLEQGILEEKDRFAQNLLYTDEDFIVWISPYYANAFVPFFNNCFQLHLDKKAGTLLNNPLLMNSYYRETTWDNIAKNMEPGIDRLRSIAQKRLVMDDLTELSRLCDFRRLKMLSQLPAERFCAVRDEMAFAMMHTCIKIFNYINKKWAVTNIRNAGHLAVSEDLKDQIHDVQLDMEMAEAKSNRDFWNVNFFKWSLGRKILIGSIALLTCIACYYVPTNEKGQVEIYSIPRQNPLSYTIQASPGDSAELHKAQDQLKQLKKDNPK